MGLPASRRRTLAAQQKFDAGMAPSGGPPSPAQACPQGRGRPRLAAVLRRLRTPRVRFHVGQVVIGDDPFNGRREGRIEAVQAPYVGLRIPGTPAGTLVFFDHRTVRLPD